MTIKKVSSIAKLENLERILLSKSFFKRDSYNPSKSPFKKGRLCHVINLIRVVPSPEQILKHCFKTKRKKG